MSHSVGAHTDALQPTHDFISDEEDADDQPAATASPAAATATTWVAASRHPTGEN